MRVRNKCLFILCYVNLFFAFELQSILRELFFQFLWLVSIAGLGFGFRLRHGFLYCADFSIDSDSEMYVIGTEICPIYGYSTHLGKGSKSEPKSVETCSA